DAAGTLQQLLESHGHRVQVCHSGGEAPDLARRCRAEVVFCDIGLPDLDGYAVARALRADPETSGVLLVALSGYASADAREKAMEAGFDIHLAKPASFAELLAVAAASHRPAGAFVPAELRPTMARHGHRRIR
ncbi:MAG TPA: response regulator, partial [Ramlibacter sp.]|nr:response regulator [Ramlibacter sp.]